MVHEPSNACTNLSIVLAEFWSAKGMHFDLSLMPFLDANLMVFGPVEMPYAMIRQWT